MQSEEDVCQCSFHAECGKTEDEGYVMSSVMYYWSSNNTSYRRGDELRKLQKSWEGFLFKTRKCWQYKGPDGNKDSDCHTNYFEHMGLCYHKIEVLGCFCHVLSTSLLHCDFRSRVQSLFFLSISAGYTCPSLLSILASLRPSQKEYGWTFKNANEVLQV